jgi:hypothetical protein
MKNLSAKPVESEKMLYNLLGSLHPEFSDSSSIALEIGLFFMGEI